MVEAIRAKLESETEPRLVAQKEPLHEAYTRYQSAVTAYEASAQAVRTALDLQHAARIQWFLDYERTHHNLCSRFVEDPARAETYFRNDAKRYVRSEEDDAGAEEGAVAGNAATAAALAEEAKS
jgi:hypothetical protein